MIPKESKLTEDFLRGDYKTPIRGIYPQQF